MKYTIIALILLIACSTPTIPVEQNVPLNLLIVSPKMNEIIDGDVNVHIVTDYNGTSKLLIDGTEMTMPEKEMTIQTTPGEHTLTIEIPGVNKTVMFTKSEPKAKMDFEIIAPDTTNQTTINIEFTTEGNYSIVAGGKITTIEGKNATITLDYGEQTIKVSLLNEDVQKTKKITVEKPITLAETLANPPSFEIYFPKSGYNAKGDLIALRLTTENFNIGGPGKDNKENEGYFQVFVNNATTPINMDSNTKTISDLQKGPITFRVIMVQNDGTTYGIERNVSFYAQSVTGSD